MFSHSRNVSVNGGTFNVLNFPLPGSRTGATGFEMLQQAAATNAIHNSYERNDPPKCHPGTRIAVLDRIMDWIRAGDHDDGQIANHVLWLYGKAGAGKSAIAQSIAEQCEAEYILLASFFFAHSDPTRNHGRSLISTITYQMVSILPEIRRHVEITIERNPLIFKLSIEAQIMSLIVKPLQELYGSGYSSERDVISRLRSRPRLIIIDGLNECEDRGIQEKFLHVIMHTLHRVELPMFFLVASRPDPHIIDVFHSPKFSPFHGQIHLDNTFLPGNDILIFIQDTFNEIKATHRLKHSIPDQWPHPDVPYYLVYKASGQFIYASVVMKYVKSPRHRPTVRLDIILGLSPAFGDTPYSELDMFYRHIFNALDDLRTSSLVLGHILLCNHTYQPYTTLGFISSFLFIDLDTIQLCVADLNSIVAVDTTVGPDGIPGQTLAISHASLSDFLLDQSRSGCFYLDAPSLHEVFARHCFQHLNEYAQGRWDSNSEMPWPNYMVYSINYLPYHCQKAQITPELRKDLFDFSWLRLQLPMPPFRINIAMISFLKCLPFLYFDGCEEAYAQHLDDYHEFLAIKIANYYRDPRLTLVLAILPDRQMLESHAVRNWEPLHKLFQIDAQLYKIDREEGLNLLNIYRSSNKDEKTFDPDLTHLLEEFLVDPQISGPCTLDKNRYSTAALWCLKYLCDHPRHTWILNRYSQFYRQARKNNPWFWHRKRRQNGALERMRRLRRLQYEADRQAYIDRDDMLSTDFGAVEKYWCSEAYELGLELLPGLLRRCIATSGVLERELILFSRTRTFGAMMGKFPRLTRIAKSAIVEFLAAIE